MNQNQSCQKDENLGLRSQTLRNYCDHRTLGRSAQNNSVYLSTCINNKRQEIYKTLNLQDITQTTVIQGILEKHNIQ